MAQCPNCGMNNPGTGTCQYCGKPLPGVFGRILQRLKRR